MYQPYYMGAYAPYNQNMNNYQQSFPQFQQPQQQPTPQPIQPVVPQNVGESNTLNAKYVSGWEEVKNIPYTEKPIMLLDANSKKLYIKGMNEKGEKEIETYSLLEDNKEKTENKNKPQKEADINEKIQSEVLKVKEELQNKILTLENQIKDLKNIKGAK